jgi:DNA-binding MarR family transcriptional regulator/predicted N-acetyltransferase YhbS
MTSIGALDERFLGRARPMGQARLLWEIGEAGAPVRDLRRRLGLDSGYVSRLLRSLERDGLLRVKPDATDRRVRWARLTRRGIAERTELDQRSESLAWSLLEPLDAGERARLVTAMADVERLLGRSTTAIEEEPAGTQDVRRCFARFFAELDRRFEGGFDLRRSVRASVADLTPPHGLVLLARRHGEPVGCGALRFHGDGMADVKRMWVSPDARGAGLGGRLLRALEQRADAAGVRLLRLTTNAALVEAVAMYRGAGYREVPPFDDEPYGHHWFVKDLTGPARLDPRPARPADLPTEGGAPHGRQDPQATPQAQAAEDQEARLTRSHRLRCSLHRQT